MGAEGCNKNGLESLQGDGEVCKAEYMANHVDGVAAVDLAASWPSGGE